jgi:UDP-2,3-diacylglucosamine pyrophosphatase LpxH
VLTAISDLHLGEGSSARMFHDASQGQRLADLCADLTSEPGSELVLLGDIFDLTAMQAPRRGLGAFARALDLPELERPARSVAQMCAAIREHNPLAIEALEAASQEIPITMVPGNHDRHLAGPEGRAALDAMGLQHVRLETEQAVRQLGDFCLVLQHGHAWDPSNATPEGGGEVMTGVLHNAVIPFLRRLAPRVNVRVDPDRLVLLRPEERVVPVLERWLPPQLFVRFVDAFLALLVENGYLSRMRALLATRDRIRERLKADDDLWERSGHAAMEALEGRRPIPGRPPPPDVLVLGHTHVLDWAVQEGRPGVQRLYANLGSWTARAADATGPLDATLPALQLDAREGELRAALRDLDDPVRALQTFEVKRR